MEPSELHYFPLAWPFLLLLLGLLVVAVALIELNVLAWAYARLGIHPRYIFAILFLSLLGSYVNIPVAQLRPEEVVSNGIVEYFGVQYIVPRVHRWPGTVIAVNVGGAVIPTLLSLYLLVKNRLYVRGVVAVAIVAAVVHAVARPTRGIGISVPIFVPALVAAVAAMVLAWRCAPPLAYIAGSLGTLIGADLMNLNKIQGWRRRSHRSEVRGRTTGCFWSGLLRFCCRRWRARRCRGRIARWRRGRTLGGRRRKGVGLTAPSEGSRVHRGSADWSGGVGCQIVPGHARSSRGTS